MTAEFGSVGGGGVRVAESAFLGRRREVDSLYEALSAADGGRGRVLWYLGRQGTGKTRLGRRFIDLAAARGLRCVRRSATGLPGELSVWRAIVLEALDPRGAGPDAIREALLRLFAGDREAGDLLVAAASDLLLPSAEVRESILQAPDAWVERMQHAVEEVLRRIAAPRGLAIVLDDAHDADPVSASMVRRLCRRIAGESFPLVLLVLSWPLPRGKSHEEHHRALEAAAASGGRVDLPRLPDREIDGIVESVFGGPAEPALRGFVRRAASGNPMFAVQTCRHLAATGSVDSRSGVVGLVAGRTIVVPPQLVDLVVERLRGLSASPEGDATYGVLRRIALLGSRALLGTLVQLLEREGRADLLARLPAHLDALVADGFIERIDGVSDPFLSLSHPLLREALVNRRDVMSDEDAGIHAAAAAALEYSFADATTVVSRDLGEHWMAAGRHDRAVDPLLEAARAAMEDARLAEAYELASLVIDCLMSMNLQGDPRESEARLVLAEVCACRGRYRQTADHLDSAERACPFVPGSEIGIRVTELRAQVAEARRQALPAIEMYRQLYDLCKVRDDHSRMCTALLRMASLRMDRGENDEALRLVVQAESHADASDEPRIRGLVHLAHGRLARKLGDAAATISHCDRAIDLLTGPRDFAERAEALFFKGAKLQELGRWQESLEVHSLGVALCRESGYSRGLGAHLGNLGAVLFALGRQAEAREAVNQSLYLREEAGDPLGVASCLNGLADIALSEERWDMARAQAARALSLSRKMGYVLGRRVAQMNLAKADFGAGEFEMAERWLRECLDSLNDDPTLTSQIAQAHSLLAAILDMRDDRAEAERHRTASEDVFRSLGLDLPLGC